MTKEEMEKEFEEWWKIETGAIALLQPDCEKGWARKAYLQARRRGQEEIDCRIKEIKKRIKELEERLSNTNGKGCISLICYTEKLTEAKRLIELESRLSKLIEAMELYHNDIPVYVLRILEEVKAR